MSILSQISILLLITGISLVLVRSNRELRRACEEGEDFVDEWLLFEERKKLLEQRKVNHKRRPDPLPDYGQGAGMDRDGWGKPGFRPAGNLDEDIEDREEKKPAPALRDPLTLLEYDDRGELVRSCPVDRLPFVIGRDPDCDLVLSDLCVARKHCLIQYEDGVYMLSDQGTHNQIWIDQTRTGQARLKEGMKFYIGNTGFLVRV